MMTQKNRVRVFLKLGFFLLLFSNTTSISSQNEKIAFEKYGVAEGLPEEYVSSIVQDYQGFIWFTTQNGLVKFDGYQMQVFKGDPSNQDALWGKNLKGGLLLASDGKLWIGSVSSSGGLASFNPKTEKFTNYVPNEKDSLKVPFANNFLLFEDVKEHIWFSSASYYRNERFLCKINTKTRKVSRYPFKVDTKYNDILLNFQIAESKKDSSVWLRDRNSNILRYNRKLDVFETQFKKGDLIPGTTVRDSIIDLIPSGKSGLISMSNYTNLFLWDPMKRKVVETYNFPAHDVVPAAGASFEDTHGNLWSLSHDNLTLINRELEERQDFKFGTGLLSFKGAPKYSTAVLPFLEENEYVWFSVTGSNRRDVSTLRYDHKKKIFEWFNSQFNEDRNNINLTGLAKVLRDRTGVLWLGTRPNLYKQNSKGKQLTLLKHDAKDPTSIPSDTITALFEDSKKQLWVGTQSGLSVHLSDNKFQEFIFENDKNNKNPFKNVYYIYEDSKNQIWTLRGGYLFKLKKNKQSFERIQLNSKNSYVAHLSEDIHGKIWVSLWNKGVYILDGRNNKVLQKFETDKKEIHGLTSNQIRSAFLDSRGFMWLGDIGDNEFGLFKYDEEKNNFKHYHYDVKDSLSLGDNEISFMVEDDLSRMWIGTDGGLSLYDHEKDIFYRNKDNMNLSSVHAYHKGSDGKMWFWSYSGGGLSLVGPDVNTVQVFGEKQGLLHNDLAVRGKIPKDTLGKLWMPTQRGLSVFDTQTRTFENYFTEDGFQEYDRRYATYKTANGDIWIGGKNGLNRIKPNKLLKKDSISPSVLITYVGILDSIYSAPDGIIFTKAVSYTDQIKLKHWQKDVSFGFVGLHYLRSKDNQYSYKLESYDKNWSTPSKERRAAYTNLSPGTYTFRVKAANADGIWNEEGASIKISISAPWWLTFWAYLFYALVSVLIALRVHKSQKERTLRLEREKNQQKELEQAKEIKKAYTELKETQNQLIQSEKMASLGELTAGIAHEIQNPLNFVNNFAEVNTELIEEMNEEIQKGNLDEVQELANDINENEKKIMFHGKRADSIVKGMLQHSRTSNGKKELTNINALADEYFRLAYHGLRAKDKAFNATMVTNFDDSIGNVHIIPQDIGRVVLNLITNAFYVVDEKKKSGIENYEPTVTVNTKKTATKIEIQVSDNGNGIPKKILSKIFQPFFTTKPTGKGTGLGLSMSYDIVTKGHGGKLKVETKQGEGTTFTILLPI